MNVFQKIKQVREAINCTYPEMTAEDIRKEVEFLARKWHKSKRRKDSALTRQQLTIYEILRKNSYAPGTVYKWLLLTTAPQQVKDKLQINSISIIQALKEKKQSQAQHTTSEKEFINALKRCVEMYISEPSENYPGKVNTQ